MRGFCGLRLQSSATPNVKRSDPSSAIDINLYHLDLEQHESIHTTDPEAQRWSPHHTPSIEGHLDNDIVYL